MENLKEGASHAVHQGAAHNQQLAKKTGPIRAMKPYLKYREVFTLFIYMKTSPPGDIIQAYAPLPPTLGVGAGKHHMCFK